MESNAVTTNAAKPEAGRSFGPAKVAFTGIALRIENGKPMLPAEELQRAIMAELAKIPGVAQPSTMEIKETQKAMADLLGKVGEEMMEFRKASKGWFDDLHQTRMAVISETAQMVKALSDVRQFFLGPDYKEQRERLADFVDLCERLQNLKACGFLDAMADTLLRLAK